jgi:hypothetical protein
MPTDADPVVGNWYEHLDKGQKFEVVAVDEDNGVVEIQHYDGDLEEVALESWYDMDVELSEPPEDWTGPMDDVETDDLDYTETDMQPEDWAQPTQEASARREPWEEGERDEGAEDDERSRGSPPEVPYEGE